MAEIKQMPFISRYDGRVLNLLPADIVQNSFGDPRDFVEYYVYDLNDNLLFSNTRYDNFVIPENGVLLSQDNTIEELNINVLNDLTEAGFELGSYRVVYNFFRKHITTDEDGSNFFIKEISSDRTELRLSSLLPENRITLGVARLIDEINDDPIYFEEFLLNFGENKLAVGVNITIDSTTSPSTILVKLIEPLPLEFSELSPLEIVEERSYSTSFEIVLDEQDITITEITEPFIGFSEDGDITITDVTEPFTGFDGNGNIIEPFTGFDENGLPVTINLTGRTNFNRFLNQNRFSQYFNFNDIVGIDEDDITRYLNFISQNRGIQIDIDFSNFADFIHFSSARERLNNFVYKLQQIENNSAISSSIITDFDPYENFLYFVSSSDSWPKYTNNKNFPINSSEALVWYEDKILEASQFDNQNPHNLIYTSPGYLLDDFESNSGYFKFVNMVGQMFDEIWLYIRTLTDLYKNQNNLKTGIPKDLVYEMLLSLGFEVNNDELSEASFKDFLNIPLIQTSSNETLISSSLDSLPRREIVEDKYKRTYHNLSYLYKTKGTLRGLKSLISMFGIPPDMIMIEELGTPSIDSGKLKETYEKFHYSVYMDGNSRIEVPWLPLNSSTRVPDSVEFMFNDRNNFNSGSYLFYVKQPSISSINFGLKIDKKDNTYANLTFKINNVSSSIEVPIYNFKDEEGWWNILIQKDNNNYKLFVKKKTDNYISHQYSSSLNYVGNKWTESTSNLSGNSFTSSLFILGQQITGSFMELRYWSEVINESSFNNHVLNPENITGNSLDSPYNSLSLRLPLGSDTNVYKLSLAGNNGFNNVG
jgi:hypothetical protein